MKVFYSWQSDLPNSTNRSFIRTALTDAVSAVGEGLDIDDADRPEVDEATKGTKGMVDITSSILRKISECVIYVADVTPVAQTRKRKALPNANVMYEMGWASHKPGYDFIIGVMNTTKYKSPEVLPFDLRGRRVLTYKLSEDATPEERKIARRALTAALEAILRDNFKGIIEKRSEETLVQGGPADQSEVSLWAPPNTQLTFPNAFGRKEIISIDRGPRAYARVIPASWSGEQPPDAPSMERAQPPVNPQSGGSGSGSFGTCELGFARYWYSSVQDDTHRSTGSIALYLEEHGEYWFADSTPFHEGKDATWLSLPRLLRAWYHSPLGALRQLDALGASKKRRIEIGATGMLDVSLSQRDQFYTPQSRKSDVRHELQRASWAPEDLARLVHKAYNSIRSAFSMTPIPADRFMEELTKL